MSTSTPNLSFQWSYHWVVGRTRPRRYPNSPTTVEDVLPLSFDKGIRVRCSDSPFTLYELPRPAIHKIKDTVRFYHDGSRSLCDTIRVAIRKLCTNRVMDVTGRGTTIGLLVEKWEVLGRFWSGEDTLEGRVDGCLKRI